MIRLKKKLISKDSATRLYGLEKPIIALTGGIATGKSTVSKILSDRGLKIIDADQLVKAIYQTDPAKNFIKTHFPEVWETNEIDFKKLRQLFFSNPDVKSKVEQYIYSELPHFFLEETKKIEQQDFFLYDVPLLFEKNLVTKMDASVLVYAPAEIQKQRLMKRDALSEEMALQIMSQQLDIEFKRSKADFIIHNTGSIAQLKKEVEKLLIHILEP